MASSERRCTVTARSPRSYEPTTTAFHRPRDFSSTPCRDNPCWVRMARSLAPRAFAYSDGIVAALQGSLGSSLSAPGNHLLGWLRTVTVKRVRPLVKLIGKMWSNRPSAKEAPDGPQRGARGVVAGRLRALNRHRLPM